MGVHELARQARFSEENLATFDEHGAVPQAILNSVVRLLIETTQSQINARSTIAHGNGEHEEVATTEHNTHDGDRSDTSDAGGTNDGGTEETKGGDPTSRDGESSENDRAGESSENDRTETAEGNSGKAYIVETVSANMPTGDDMAKSDHYRPRRLRTLQAMMADSALGSAARGSLTQRANAEAAAAAGRAPPVVPSNALVIPHTGEMVSDFYDHTVSFRERFSTFPLTQEVAT